MKNFLLTSDHWYLCSDLFINYKELGVNEHGIWSIGIKS